MPRGKKRKSTKRKMGGVKVRRKSGDKVMRALGVVAGLVGAAIGNDKIATTMTTPINPYLLAGLEAGIGWFGPDMIAPNNALVEGIGLGLIGAAGVAVLKESGAIAGIDNVVNGWGDALGGYNNRKVINGISNVPDIIAKAAGGETSNSSNGNSGPKYSGSYAGMMNGFNYQKQFDENN